MINTENLQSHMELGLYTFTDITYRDVPLDQCPHITMLCFIFLVSQYIFAEWNKLFWLHIRDQHVIFSNTPCYI